jgi:hypothetical protein
MGHHPIRFGFIAGILQVCISLVLYFINKDYFLTYGSLIQYIIFIYCMVLATQAHKKDLNGFIILSEAFRPAWLTFILAATIVSIFTFVLMNYIDPDLSTYFKELQLEAFEKASDLLKLSDTDKAAQMEVMKNSEPYGIKSLAFNLPFSFIIPGALLALIIAAIIKKDPIINQA